MNKSFYFLSFILFLVFRDMVSLHSLNSPRPGCPQTQTSACLCIQSTGIKGSHCPVPVNKPFSNQCVVETEESFVSHTYNYIKQVLLCPLAECSP